MEINMKDFLQDLVAHTHSLGFLPLVKISADDKETVIESMAEDRSVILNAKTHNPVDDLDGVFGMPNLNKLDIHLKCPEYKEGAGISVVKQQRNGEEVPTGIHFQNSTGDFENDYRFMNQSIIEEKLKTVKFRGAKWEVEVSPALNAIQRFQFQAGANTEHTTFLAKTDGDILKFTFGDQSTHGGEFTFATGISGKLTKTWAYPVNAVLSILKAADVNNTVMSFSDSGAMQITLDSGLATYKYIVPAQA